MWFVGLIVWDHIYLFIQYCTIISLLLRFLYSLQIWIMIKLNNSYIYFHCLFYSWQFVYYLFNLIHLKTLQKIPKLITSADKNLKNAHHFIFNVIKKHVLILCHCSTHIIMLNKNVQCLGKKRDFWQWPTYVIKHIKC